MSDNFPGYEDSLQRQAQELRTGLLSFLVWITSIKLEVGYICLRSSYIYNYMLNSIYKVSISITLSLGLDQHIHNLFKRLSGQ